jgi:hypothetical protein
MNTVPYIHSKKYKTYHMKDTRNRHPSSHHAVVPDWNILLRPTTQYSANVSPRNHAIKKQSRNQPSKPMILRRRPPSSKKYHTNAPNANAFRKLIEPIRMRPHQKHRSQLDQKRTPRHIQRR